ncbi:MAG: hypothetical protein QXS08_01455 [Nitrososphaerota archaeon]
MENSLFLEEEVGILEMDRVARGLFEVGLGLGVGLAPTLAGLALTALGMASSPLVRGLITELAGLLSVNLLLSILASPVVLIGLIDFRNGIRARAEALSTQGEESRTIPTSP